MAKFSAPDNTQALFLFGDKLMLQSPVLVGTVETNLGCPCEYTKQGTIQKRLNHMKSNFTSAYQQAKRPFAVWESYVMCLVLHKKNEKKILNTQNSEKKT